MIASLDVEAAALISTSRRTEAMSVVTPEIISSDHLEATRDQDAQETTSEMTEGREGEETLLDERTFSQFGMQVTCTSEDTPLDCDGISAVDPGEVPVSPPATLTNPSSGGSSCSILSRVLLGSLEFKECDNDDVCSWPCSASLVATGFLVQMRQPRSKTCDSCRSVVSDNPGIIPE